MTVIVFAVLISINGDYLNWDYSNPETAVMGVGIHAFEWLFVRIVPFALIGVMVGIIMTRKRK